jgi:threonine dehydrogenase-like Zn-dependent dehydrogenase
MVDLKAERMARQNEIEANRDPKTTIQQAMLDNSQAATSKLTELLDKLVTSGAIDPTVVIDARGRFDDAPALYQLLATQQRLKAVITP